MTSKSSRRQQRRLSCPFSSLKSHPSGICRGDPASRFPSLEETRAGKTHGGARARRCQATLYLSHLPPPVFPVPLRAYPHSAASSARPPPPSVPYSTHRSPGVLGSRKYRLSYSFEGAENRYGAFCARATGEISNRRCRRSFSRAPGLALAGLAARGPPLVGV